VISISLLFVQREELVLLLIQLRRSQTKLEQMRVWVRDKLARRRPDEKAYRIQLVFVNFCIFLRILFSVILKKFNCSFLIPYEMLHKMLLVLIAFTFYHVMLC